MGKYNKLLDELCEKGDIEGIENFSKKYIVDWDICLNYACTNGDIKLMNYAISNGAYDYYSGYLYACQNGHISIVKLMLELITKNGLEQTEHQNVKEYLNRCVIP